MGMLLHPLQRSNQLHEAKIYRPLNTYQKKKRNKKKGKSKFYYFSGVSFWTNVTFTCVTKVVLRNVFHRGINKEIDYHTN